MNHLLNLSKENIAKIDFDFLNEALNANIRLKELVDELKISKELDSKGWSKKDSRTIKILYDGLINKHIVSLDRADYNIIQVIPFANVHVLLFLIPERENSKNYRIYNYSDYEMVLINEDRQQFSKYEAVDLDQLILVDIFNIDDYISSYLTKHTSLFFKFRYHQKHRFYWTNLSITLFKITKNHFNKTKNRQ